MAVTSHAQADQHERAIAIVGIGCRYPGHVTDVESFWQLLCAGTDAIGEIPADRIDVSRFFNPEPSTPGKMSTLRGGFLDHIDELDADFFRVSPLEAERLDPQQRVLLETAWEAVEDAGIDVASLEGRRAGVFIGQWVSDFENRLFQDPSSIDFYMTMGSGRYAASGRLSYILGLRGPSLTLDCACSSSLAAIHLAIQSLRSGESELALAGGANIILQPHISIAYSQSRMMAADGRCKFGDANADGYVRSEGAAVLVLKPLARAIEDGDLIYAVIRGSALNNDGHSSGMMGRPSRLGHEELLRSAYRDAGVVPGQVGYVEAHGTGTRAGDPVELGALGLVLSEGRAADAPFLVGSVKTNIGHTEGAAGVAGLIKAALAVKHGLIPASLNCSDPSPMIPWSGIPCRIARQRTTWPDTFEQRIAGVSAFGISGTNVHVVLEPPPQPRDTLRPRQCSDLPYILPVSARAPQAMRALAGSYAALLSRDEGTSLSDVCWSAATRRTQFEQRAAFIASNASEMIELLTRFSAGEETAETGRAEASEKPRLAFVLPGQGGQWTGMARELLQREPAFRETLSACDEAAKPWCDYSILDVLEADRGETDAMLERIDVIQPVLVALAIGYAALLRARGIVPEAVVGHSMGEVAAAYIAGAIDLATAMRVICRRSALMRATSGAGAMALLDVGAEDAQRRIDGREQRIAVAVSNSPRSSVVSGEPAAIAEVMSECERDGIYCRLVKVDVASHSPQMEPVAAALAAELADLRVTEPTLSVYSTVDAQLVTDSCFDAGYWSRNLRQPVRFADAVSAMLRDGISTFVELGPHPVLLHAIEQTSQFLDIPTAAAACGYRDQSDLVSISRTLGRIWAAGHRLDWPKILPPGGRFVRLPRYPWQRERYWSGQAELRSPAAAHRAVPNSLDSESASWLYRLAWEPAEASGIPVPTRGKQRWLVLAESRQDADTLAHAMRASGADAMTSTFTDLDTTLANVDDLSGVIALCPNRSDTAYLPIQLLQSALHCSADRKPKLWFVTRGAHAVGEQSRSLSVEAAALWGAARVVGEEHPELWGGLVDLDPAAPLVQDAKAVANQLISPDGEDQLAWRAGSRFALRLVSDADVGPVGAFEWRNDASYLITGGFGGVALAVAGAMAGAGVRRLILMARTLLPPRVEWSGVAADTPIGRRIAAVRHLEAKGVAVHVAAVDVGDEAQLSDFLDRWHAEGWPPIKGVVHAAVTLQNGLSANMDRASFDTVMRSKLTAARNLDRLLPDLNILVLFSSMTSFLPHVGIANYAAANAGLDALALDRSARGQATISIAWGPWRDTGLLALGNHVSEDFERQGLMSLAPDKASQLFSRLVASRAEGRAIMAIDWQQFQASRSGRELPLIRALERAQASSVGKATVEIGLESADPEARTATVEALVRDAVAKTLKIAPARLDSRKAFGTMGLTSLLAMELRNRLEAALQRPLPATLAWNHPTIEALAAHLVALMSEPTPTSFGREARGTAASAERVPATLNERLREAEALSDAEVLAALRVK